MPQVLLINPVSRKEVKAMAKKKRTPAQQRATRKMIAANRSRAKGATRKAAPRRKARVSHAKTRRRPARSATREPNPSPRKKHRRSTKAAAQRAGRVMRYRRKNPIGMGGFVKDTLIPSAVGGAGALALDLVMNVIPLPAAMKAGPMRPVIRVAGAIGLGMIATKVASRRIGGQVAAGALTVTLYDLLRSAVAKSPAAKFFGLADYYDPSMGAYVGEDGSVGAYVDDGTGQQMLGYVDAGMQVGEMSPDGSMEGYETGVYR